MPKAKLTTRYVAAIEPPKHGRVERFDVAMPGFGLRISDSGVKSWFILYRVDGRLVRQTLGRYPAIGLAEARKRAATALDQVEGGRDPRREAALAAASMATRRASSFRIVAEQFRARHLAGLRRGHEVWASIERDVIPEWGDRPISEISRRDVITLLDGIQDRGKPYARNRRLAAVRKLFNWCLERDLVAANPAAHIRALPETMRQRILSDDELRAVWEASMKLPSPAGPLIRLLMITGQRRGEVGGMEWPEVDLANKVWTLPAARTKNALAHEIPLSKMAIAELAALKRFEGIANVMTTGGRDGAPLGAFTTLKSEIDRLSGVKDWVLHDLRRTFRTRLGGLGVQPEIAERLINHVPAGVRAVYDLHSYRAEKRDAMNRWAKRLREIVDGKSRRQKARSKSQSKPRPADPGNAVQNAAIEEKSNAKD
jgi:integrase